MLRVLTFRARPGELLAFGDRELAAGLFACWLVGMGRWWDDPHAVLAQKLGLGSVAYVFVLAAVLWLLYLPWRIPGWRYKPLAGYVAMTAPPAVLYAVPVERFLPESQAALYNGLALSLVAAWRLGLLYRYFRAAGSLGRLRSAAGALFPVLGIVMVLVALEYLPAILDPMGGFRGSMSEETQALIVTVALLILVPLFPFLGLYYLYVVYARWREAAAA